MAERVTSSEDPVDTLLNKLDRSHKTYLRARDRLANEAVRAIVEAGGVISLDGFIAAMHGIDPRHPQDGSEQNKINQYRKLDGIFQRPDRRTALAHTPPSGLGRTMIKSIGVLPPGNGTALVCKITEAEPGQFQGVLVVQVTDVCNWDSGTPECLASGGFIMAATTRADKPAPFSVDYSHEYTLGMPGVWDQANPSRGDIGALAAAERLAFFLAHARLPE